MFDAQFSSKSTYILLSVSDNQIFARILEYFINM